MERKKKILSGEVKGERNGDVGGKTENDVSECKRVDRGRECVGEIGEKIMSGEKEEGSVSNKRKRSVSGERKREEECEV